MIWLRRVLTIPLGLLLFVLLLVAVVILQVSDTFLDPGFYPEELREANIYEFALVDVSTSFLDEFRELEGEDLPEGFEENPLVTSGLSTEDIVSSLNRALPPEFVQAQVEQVFDELGRYVTAERDEFQVTIQAGDQVGILVEEVKSLLRKSDAYNLLFEELVLPEADKALAQELPFDLAITSERLVESARRVVTREWVEGQVDAILDETTPYVEGDRDTFEIRVDLADRVELALAEVKTLLREIEVYDLLYDEVVAPEIEKRLGDEVELPFGFSVTNDEVLSALRRVAPPDWVQEQAEALIDGAGPYFTGKASSFSVTVSLVDNKREARNIIQEIAARKFTDAVKGLTPCTASQLASLDLSDLRTLPPCIPPQVKPDVIMDELASRVAETVDTQVLGPIPDDVTFTDVNLRQTLSLAGAAENLDLVDDVREIIGNGWTYTETDLRNDLVKLGEEVVGRTDAAGRRSFSVPTGAGTMFLDAELGEARGSLEVDLEAPSSVPQAAGELKLRLEDDPTPGRIAILVVVDGNGDAVQGAEVTVADDEPLDLLDDVRAYLADGWTYAHTDFREDLVDLGDESDLEDFDRGRDRFSQARTFRLLVYVPALLFLVAIGFLGGRRWSSRIAWAAGSFAIVSAIIFIGFGPVYSAFGEPLIEDAREEALEEIDFDSDFESTQRLVVNKRFDMAESVINGFASGVAIKSLVLLVIGLVVLGVSLNWARVWSLARKWRRQEQQPLQAEHEE